MPSFIGYARVVLSGRHRRSFDLADQERRIADYAARQGGGLVGQVIESEQEGVGPWPRLVEALAEGRKSQATLIIGRLGHSAADPAFLSILRQSGLPFVALDAPLANQNTIELMLLEANRRALKSSRIKAALAGKETHGSGAQVSDAARQSSVASRRRMRDSRLQYLEGLIAKLKSEGATTNAEIAARLNQMAVPRARGGAWTSVHVSRMTGGARLKKAGTESNGSA